MHAWDFGGVAIASSVLAIQSITRALCEMYEFVVKEGFAVSGSRREWSELSPLHLRLKLLFCPVRAQETDLSALRLRSGCCIAPMVIACSFQCCTQTIHTVRLSYDQGGT